MEGDLIEGTVKWFHEGRGIGFIEGESGVDIFIHYTVIDFDGFKTLEEGEKVFYKLEQGPKGPFASYLKSPNPTVREKDKE